MKKYILKWVRNGIRSLKEIVYKYLGIPVHRFSATAVAGIPGPNQTLPIRVSQKIQKSEFWNGLYHSGFHRLDEPPEKISAL